MRSSWKVPFFDNKTISSIKLDKNKKSEIIAKDKRFTFVPSLIGTEMKIHNGIKYLHIVVQEEHIGYKYGNFIITKKRCIFRNSKKK